MPCQCLIPGLCATGCASVLVEPTLLHRHRQSQRHTATRRRNHTASSRRGIITFWTLLCLPILVVLLFVVAEVGHLWQARAQLENALEAASLASVKKWGALGGQAKHLSEAQAMGEAYARANTVHGREVNLHDPQTTAAAAWSFGSATRRDRGFDFSPDHHATEKLAVVLYATVKVPRLAQALLGPTVGEAMISGQCAAFYDTSSDPPRTRLIRVNEGHHRAHNR